MDGTAYPVSFSVNYPGRELNRVTSLFRIFTVIPIAIVLGAVAGGTWQWSYGHGTSAAAAGGRGRAAVLRPTADDLVPAEVPALVVRLEPGVAAVQHRARSAGAVAAVAALVSVLVPALGAAPAGAADNSGAVPPIGWHRCPAGSAGAMAGGFVCATVAAPLDYQDRPGRRSSWQ